MTHGTTDSPRLSLSATLVRGWLRPSWGCAASMHDDERGMMTAVNIMLLCLTLLLFVLLWNVSLVTREKVQMQNAADAIAISSGTQLARGMNAITATNHIMGEMMSLVIVHEALGAKLVYAPQEIEDTDDEDERLDLAYAAATALGAKTPSYELVRQSEGIDAQRTILKAKRNLKDLLADVYYTKAAARAMQMTGIPPVVAAGIALEYAMDILERLIDLEYRMLKALHAVADATSPLKFLLADAMLPLARQYTELVVEQTPLQAHATAARIAEVHEVRMTTQPFVGNVGQLRLPVVKDPFAKLPAMPNYEPPCIDCDCPSARTDVTRDQITKVSQLSRATFPWVNYHRKPIIDILTLVVPLSEAGEIYFHESNGTSKHLLDKMQTDHRDLGLFVVGDPNAGQPFEAYPSPDKGYEPWTGFPVPTTDSARRADTLFSIVGLAHQSGPRLLGNEPGMGSSTEPVFRQHHTQGRTAIAQATLYNGNAQRPASRRIDLTCKRIVPIRQADVGWDTLNWREGTRPYELIGIGAGVVPEYPQIKVNWQVKLVPVTANQISRLGMHAWHHGDAAKRMLPLQSLRSH